MSKTILMVGTRKGLWLGHSDEARREWTWTGPHFDMTEVYSGMVDKRSGGVRLFAGPSSPWTGPQVCVSDDLGETWQETKGAHFPESFEESVERVWQLAPGTEDNVVLAGTEPGAVFRSDDGGQTFALIEGLWNHPHRKDWAAGFGGQAFHTILAHPTDPQSITVALSTGGCYQTSDGGVTWEPRNQGVRAEFLPEGEQYPEFGQCVHKVARHPSAPDDPVHAEPRRRLPVRRPRGLVDVDRRRPPGGLRLLDGRAPARAGDHLHLPDPGRRRAVSRRRQGPRLPVAGRRRLVGGSSTRGFPTTSTSA